LKKKEIVDDDYVLNLVYDFVLNPKITERERKIGLMAKADLERKKYVIFVLNKTVVSLMQEAIRNKSLSPEADKFYNIVNDLLTKNKPFGTNLGSFLIQNGYLD